MEASSTENWQKWKMENLRPGGIENLKMENLPNFFRIVVA